MWIADRTGSISLVNAVEPERVLRTIRLGRSPTAIAVETSTVWVAMGAGRFS